MLPSIVAVVRHRFEWADFEQSRAARPRAKERTTLASEMA
jgi:hypothetical protein